MAKAVEKSRRYTWKWVKPDEVHPYELNAKIHDEKQVGKIAASIKEFGWRQPILVDTNMVIIAGHGRLAAAKFLGSETIPIMVAEDLNDTQVRLLRLADNKVAEAPWDEDLLRQDLGDLMAEVPDLNFEVTGFDMDEISEMLGLTAGRDDAPPQEFAKADPNAPTEHRCPKCGYAWNGKAA